MSMHASVFAYVREFIRAKAGVTLGADKEYLVEARLQPLARVEGFASLEGLVQQLRTGASTDLVDKVIDALTTHETSFFRDMYPFETLRGAVLPALLAARARSRTLNILSAACSTGQEPYSIAMVLREGFPELVTWSVNIIGLDISQAVLEKARRGRYDAVEVGRGLPPEMLKRYFDPVDGGYQAIPALRALTDFRHGNLAGAWPQLPRIDLLLLRNVLIYFDIPTRNRILASARAALAPDGYLFLGGAETAMNLEGVYERVQAERIVYFRPAA